MFRLGTTRPAHRFMSMAIARNHVRVEFPQQVGLRCTRAIEAMLDLFLSNPELVLTHADLEAQLADRGLNVNRVTIYRRLDRLVVAQVLERHPDKQSRNWRFGWLAQAHGNPMPRFECDECHLRFDLPEASGPTAAVAQKLLSTISDLGMWASA